MSRIAKIEFALAAILLFVLPTLESPKNIAFGLFVLTWSAHRLMSGDWRGWKLGGVDFVLLAMWLATLLSTIVNWPYPNVTKGVVDTTRLTFTAWCIYRAGYGERERRWLVWALVTGVLPALGVGVLELATGKRHQLEFHSAGIITQSASYLAMVLVLVLGVLGLSDREAPRSAKIFWIVSAAAMSAGLFVMGSRGVLLAFFFVLVPLIFLFGRRWVWIVGACVVFGGVFWYLSNHERFIHQWNKAMVMVGETGFSEADQERYTVWRITLAQVKQGESLLAGIGPRNFSTIDIHQLKLDPPIPAKTRTPPHAHNLFLNKLVEEGVIGLAALLGLFGVVARQLVRDYREGRHRSVYWIGALGALVIPVIAGSFNTPFYQEHGMLAMSLFALYFSQTRAASVVHK
jgi:O-antigen ligase